MTQAPKLAKPPKRPLRLLTVTRAWRLTPNMIRVTLTSPELHDLHSPCEGANCKLMLPAPGQRRDDFAAQLVDGPRPVTRTYTVRNHRAAANEIDIDFVAHGDEGPASAWAIRAAPGAYCGFAGPGQVKLTSFEADWYLLAADLSALPVAAATLEAMPRDARGVAIFEIPSDADRQTIEAPAGVALHWVLAPDPLADEGLQERLIRALDLPAGRIQTCIAGESGTIQALRTYLLRERGIPGADAYISGYWKRGLVEDEHQRLKRAESAAA